MKKLNILLSTTLNQFTKFKCKWIKKVDPLFEFLYQGTKKLIEFKTYLQTFPIKPTLKKWFTRLLGLTAIIVFVFIGSLLEPNLRTVIALVMHHGTVVFLMISFYYTGLKPTWSEKTRSWPTDRFISTRDLRVIGQRGKFWSIELAEYWGISNFFLFCWVGFGFPIFLCLSSIVKLVILAKLALGFLVMGWVFHLTSFMCVNKLDYFVRYYSEANLVTAQQVIPYTMSSSFALVFFGLSTQLPRPIPPLLDLENIDKTHGGKAFSHTFGSHESTGAAPPTPSKVCSGCGLSEEMFAKQLEALRRKKLDSEAALPKAPTSGKVGRTPVLMVVDSVGDAAMIEACFDTVETASAKFRTSQGLLPNTNMLPIFNDRTSLILELGKKKIEDSVMYEVNARLQFYKTQPSEWQDLVKKYFSIADHLKEVAHNSPSWDNFYKQHYTQLVGLYLLQEVSGEVDWGWRADRARVGVVAATVRR